jgi:ethanolamine utilization microcompartment shell protein EutS
MRSGHALPLRFLVEWFTPNVSGRTITDFARRLQLSLATLAAQPDAPELLYALQVPQDAYAFGVFAADSAETVAQICQQAGLPADRVTAAVEGIPTNYPLT